MTVWEFITSPLGALLLTGFCGACVFIWRTHISATLAQQAIKIHQETCDSEREEIHDLVKDVSVGLSNLANSQNDLNTTLKTHIAVGEERSKNTDRRLYTVEKKLNGHISKS